MRDVELGKEILEKEDYALVVVKNQEVIFKSREKGIKPMYILSQEMKDRAYGASIADKVIGRGAALLCNYLGIKEVHGNLISKGAIEVLEKGHISYTFNELCEYIKNRDGSGYCPIEIISMDVDKDEDFLQELHVFFKKMKTKGE